MIEPVVIYNSLLNNFSSLLSVISTMIGNSWNSSNNFDLGLTNGKINNNQNWEIYTKKLNIDLNRIVFEKQTHSTNIKYVDKPEIVEDNDGLITDIPNLFLYVSAADCIPIHIYDNKKRVVASVHSGWRGTQKKILEKCFYILIDEFKCNPDNLFVYLGPSICMNCFEVDFDVATLFPDKYVRRKNSKFLVDLKEINIDILKNFNVPEKNILVSKLCTYCSKNFLHSYRRDRENSGRLAGLIGMRN